MAPIKMKSGFEFDITPFHTHETPRTGQTVERRAAPKGEDAAEEDSSQALFIGATKCNSKIMYMRMLLTFHKSIHKCNLYIQKDPRRFSRPMPPSASKEASFRKLQAVRECVEHPVGLNGQHDLPDAILGTRGHMSILINSIVPHVKCKMYIYDIFLEIAGKGRGGRGGTGGKGEERVGHVYGHGHEGAKGKV